MKKDTVIPLSVVLGAVLISIVLYVWLEIILLAVLASIIGAGVALLVYTKLSQDSNSTTSSNRIVPKGPSLKELMEHLVLMNLRIREEAVPSDVMSRLETIIDKLRKLLPELNEGHHGSELTWVVNRIVVDYFPRVVNPYLALSTGDRNGYKPRLFQSLDALDQELDETNSLVNEGRTSDFRTKSQFIIHRFGFGA